MITALQAHWCADRWQLKLFRHLWVLRVKSITWGRKRLFSEDRLFDKCCQIHNATSSPLFLKRLFKILLRIFVKWKLFLLLILRALQMSSLWWKTKSSARLCLSTEDCQWTHDYHLFEPWVWTIDINKNGQPVSTPSHCTKIMLNHSGCERCERCHPDWSLSLCCSDCDGATFDSMK